MDMATKRVEWHEAVFPGAEAYTDMCPAPNGLVYGVVDRSRFFVFDPAKRAVIYEKDTEADFGRTISHQGPRVFVLGPDGEHYMLFVKGIARIDPATHDITLARRVARPHRPRRRLSQRTDLLRQRLPSVQLQGEGREDGIKGGTRSRASKVTAGA